MKSKYLPVSHKTPQKVEEKLKFPDLTGFSTLLNIILVNLSQFRPRVHPVKSLMGEGFMGVHTPLYELFLFLTSFFKIRKRFFDSVIKIISGVFI